MVIQKGESQTGVFLQLLAFTGAEAMADGTIIDQGVERVGWHVGSDVLWWGEVHILGKETVAQLLGECVSLRVAHIGVT